MSLVGFAKFITPAYPPAVLSDGLVYTGTDFQQKKAEPFGAPERRDFWGENMTLWRSVNSDKKI